VTIALQDLKSAILKHNRDFCNGVLIDKVWLQKWLKLHSTSKEEENLVSPDHTIYVSDFFYLVLDTQAVEWSVSAKENGCALQNQYKKFVKTLPTI
jgi:type II secretory pathway component PulL